MGAISINSDDYNKFTKTKLIKVIENLKEQIDYFEEREDYYEEQLERLKAENERHSRSIHDYEQRAKEEELYSQFPQLRPLWMEKG